MTQAQKYASKATNAAEIMEILADSPAKVDQDWESETTIYTFDDNSQVFVHGEDYTVA